jgi:hypothetical protein
LDSGLLYMNRNTLSKLCAVFGEEEEEEEEGM